MTKSSIRIDLSDDTASVRTTVIRGGVTSTWQDCNANQSLGQRSIPLIRSGLEADIVVNWGRASWVWDSSGRAYQPTMDAFRLVTAIESLELPLATVADIGAGAGFVGLTLATRQPVAKLTLLEPDSAALSQALANARRLVPLDSACQLRFLQSRFAATTVSEMEAVDLLVCNAPYFPAGSLLKGRGRSQATDDLGLIEALFELGPQIAQTVVLTCSSTHRNAIDSLALNHGREIQVVAEWTASFPLCELSAAGKSLFSDDHVRDESLETVEHSVQVIEVKRRGC